MINIAVDPIFCVIGLLPIMFVVVISFFLFIKYFPIFMNFQGQFNPIYPESLVMTNDWRARSARDEITGDLDLTIVTSTFRSVSRYWSSSRVTVK